MRACIAWKVFSPSFAIVVEKKSIIWPRDKIADAMSGLDQIIIYYVGFYSMLNWAVKMHLE